MSTRNDVTTELVIPSTQIGFRRVSSAWSMPLAIGLILVSNLIFATQNPEGLSEEIGGEVVELYGQNPALWNLSAVAALVGILFFVPGILSVVKALRLDRPRLSMIAGALMLTGYICYFGIVFTTFDTVSWVIFDPQALTAFVDSAPMTAASMPFFLLFVIGNLLGTALLGITIIIGKEIPRWAGILVLGWPVGHLANLLLGNEWFAVAGGALELVGFAVIATTITRMNDQQWRDRS